MIPFAKNMKNKPNTFIPVKQIDTWIDRYINSPASPTRVHDLSKVWWPATDMQFGLRAILLRQFGCGFVRMKEEGKKKQKTWKKGVSQSPLESSKLAGDNGIVNWGKSFPKASVRMRVRDFRPDRKRWPLVEERIKTVTDKMATKNFFQSRIRVFPLMIRINFISFQIDLESMLLCISKFYQWI